MPPKKKAPIYNPFEKKAASEGAPDTSIHIVDEALYGPTQKPAPGLQTAYAIPLDLISPDPAQPRRAIPDDVRKATKSGESEWQAWHRVAEELHGKPIDLVALLKGEGDGPEDDPLGIPLMVGFLNLVGLAASIYRDGQTNAITVVKIPGPNEAYEIETGERRWQALKMLNEALQDEAYNSIKAREVPKANVWRQATENNAREPLNAIGMARQIALLLMDIYRGKDGISLLPYRQMVQPSDCDRKFYAQVSNGNVYRIPRGMGERIMQATGLKSRAQLARHRALLDIADEVWIEADQEGWAEFKIRELVRPPSQPRDTLSIDNVSTESVNPVTDSTRLNVDSRPSPFGQRTTPLPATDGPGTPATGEKYMHMGARVELVRIEDTARGPQAVVWTLDASGVRKQQHRVNPGDLKELHPAWHKSAAVGLRHGIKIENGMRNGYVWPTGHSSNQWRIDGTSVVFRPALNSIGAADLVDPGTLINVAQFEWFDRSDAGKLKALITQLREALAPRITGAEILRGWRGGGGLYNRIVWAAGGAHLIAGSEPLITMTHQKNQIAVVTPNQKKLMLDLSEVFEELRPAAQTDPTVMSEADKEHALNRMMGDDIEDDEDDEIDEDATVIESDTQVPDASSAPALEWYELPEWASAGKKVRDPEAHAVGDVINTRWSNTRGWIIGVRFANHDSEFPIEALAPFTESTAAPDLPRRERHPALANPQHMIIEIQVRIDIFVYAAEMLLRLEKDPAQIERRKDVLVKMRRIRAMCAQHILIKLNQEGKEATVKALQDLYETASGLMSEVSDTLFTLFQEALIVADDLEADMQQKGAH